MLKRYDKCGRDVTDSPGLWDEGDVLKEQRMSVDDAVRVAKVLCDYAHNGIDDWTPYGNEQVLYTYVQSRSAYQADDEDRDRLTLFEARAIADAYERQAGRDMPATRWLAHKIERVLAPANALKWHDDSRFSGGGADPVTYGDLRAFAAEWEPKP